MLLKLYLKYILERNTAKVCKTWDKKKILSRLFKMYFILAEGQGKETIILYSTEERKKSLFLQICKNERKEKKKKSLFSS